MDDFFLFDTAEKPESGRSFKINTYGFFLCLRGTTRGTVDLIPFQLSPGMMMVNVPGQLVTHFSASEDFGGTSLVMTQHFVDSLGLPYNFSLATSVREHPVLNLKSGEFAAIQNYCKMVKGLLREKRPFQAESLRHLTCAYAYSLGSYLYRMAEMRKLSNEEVSVQVLHSAVGPISESDVTLAKASHALVIGFNVRANPLARDMARRDGVEIKYYSIIYDVLDDIKKGLEGMLSPELREKILGYAEIREVYNITGVGKVAGCMITEGMVKRGAKIRLLRDNVVIHDGSIGQLKRFKEDVKEVKEGYECGISFENYNDIQKGDFIECYEIEEIAAKL